MSEHLLHGGAERSPSKPAATKESGRRDEHQLGCWGASMSGVGNATKRDEDDLKSIMSVILCKRKAQGLHI